MKTLDEIQADVEKLFAAAEAGGTGEYLRPWPGGDEGRQRALEQMAQDIYDDEHGRGRA